MYYRSRSTSPVIMLLGLRFRNFYSFREEGEISLIAHKADKTLRSSLISTTVNKSKRISFLPVLAIYGANSAGKTNILKALDVLKTAVLDSYVKWDADGETNIRVFGVNANHNNHASIEIEFLIESTRYVYGVVGNRQFFSEEWLKYYPAGRERTLFSRVLNLGEPLSENDKKIQLPGEMSVEFGDDLGTHDEFETQTIAKIRQNSLLLSILAQENNIECRKVYSWFRNIEIENVTSSSDRQYAMSAAERIADDVEAKQAILSIMKAADPNLLDIKVRKTNVDSEPPEFLDEMGSRFKAMFIRDFRYAIAFSVSDGSKKLNLSLDVQSRGFQKLFALSARIVTKLRSGGVFVIDELETSIHPHLARFIVDLFQNPEINTGKCQLIFTTHDTNLLDQSLLRRDQIWFAEKNKCSSEVYSLLDFSPRKDENLERGYLRGRYGAIPALGLSSDWFSAPAIITSAESTADE